MDAFVEWEKCKAGTWCILVQLDLEHKHFDEMEAVLQLVDILIMTL